MPEIRYNPAANEWVIIATDRAKRPEDFAGQSAAVSKDSAANCPFCPGREQKTPPELFAIRDPDTQPNTPGWQVRVTQNAFPALRSEGVPSRCKTPAGFLKMNGVGSHEVIIESSEHEQIIATMSLSQVENIFQAYQARFTALAQDPRFEEVILFKNHGRNAGTSLHHPHSQIIALPVLPASSHARLMIAEQHFNLDGSCLYCDMMKMEKEEGERVVLETEGFFAFEPFASRFPFETWILPKKHDSGFDEISAGDCRELAGVVQVVLKKLNKTLGNPDFNYAVYSAPCRQKKLEFFHWHIKIFPRIANPAGFELGSGVMINSMVPETAAKYLREVLS